MLTVLPTTSSSGRQLAAAFTIALSIVAVLAGPALASPSITLDPDQGLPGDTFQITGAGFPDGQQVQILWDGSPLGSPTSADENGEFTATRSVPGAATEGIHTVTAIARPSQVAGEAMFTVSSTSTTTTTSQSPSTTEAPEDGSTTTTSEGGTTTTQAVDDGQSQPLVLTSFEVEPDSGRPGEEISIAATFDGEPTQITIWLGDVQLGPSAQVGGDGLLLATRAVPELEPGTQWLKLETEDGRLLHLARFEVADIEPEESMVDSCSPVCTQTWVIAIGLTLLALLLVSWMLRNRRGTNA